MLEYVRIDILKGIDANKTSDAHECIICQYTYFLKIYFRLILCEGCHCHNITQKSMFR